MRTGYWPTRASCTSLEERECETCDVVIAATGDDKANLTTSLLAKTEFGVTRVVARVNDARNEWLFTEAWGVDVAVSAPRALVAAIEGAIDIGHLVRLMELRQGQVSLAKLILPEDDPLVGKRVRDIPLPENTVLAIVIRDSGVILPQPDDVLRGRRRDVVLRGRCRRGPGPRARSRCDEANSRPMSLRRCAGQYDMIDLTSACQRTADVLAE